MPSYSLGGSWEKTSSSESKGFVKLPGIAIIRRHQTQQAIKLFLECVT